MAEQVRRFIRKKEVLRILSVGKTTLNAKIKAGELKSYPLGARAVGFLSTDIDAWIESRIKAVETK